MIGCNLHAIPSYAQLIIPNSNFEQFDALSDTKSSYWKIGGNIDKCTIDSINVWKGKYSMYILRTAKEGIGLFFQELPFHVDGLKKYKISGFIKVKNVKEQYAGIFVKILDKDGNIICKQDMGDLKIKGTQEWKSYEAEFYADETAVKIKVAGLLYGSGEAWFDDLLIQEIPLSSKEAIPIVNEYIDQYFKIVENNSIIKDTSYLAELKKNTRRLCTGSSSLEYCHYILKNYTTRKLNDGHSFFLNPDEVADWQNGNKTIENGLANYASGKLTKEHIAYINVPTFVSLDSVLIAKYADSLQSVIAKLDQKAPKGWIIDLRNNMGGNSWAMILGLGPLLGNGIFGYTISANGKKMTRIYTDKWVGWDTIPMLKKSNSYHLKKVNRPIAILYGNQTSSAGEVVAIAFRGMQNTRSFGSATEGSTTRIDNFKLSDGAYLNLASGVDADRNGIIFGSKVIPDKITAGNESALSDAIAWILDF
ncbi:MAG: S41 family peptidase [Bacteroidia bacterium]